MNKDEKLKKLFDNPLLEHVEQEDVSLFDLPESLKKEIREKPDYIAQRVPCDNFSDYEAGFKQVHLDL